MLPRQEKPIDPSAGPLQVFAAELRAARSRTGLTYKEMAARGFASQSTLSKAASGEPPPPTWAAVQAYVSALGLSNELDYWSSQWTAMRAAHAELYGQAWPDEPREPAVAPAPPPTVLVSAATARPRRRRITIIAAVGVAVLLVGAVVIYGISVVSRHASPGGQPPAAAQVDGQPAHAVLIRVQNMVAVGAVDLKEDSTPAYLSTRPVPFCARNGCKVEGTEMWTGATLAVTCYVTGASIANYNVDSPESKQNPHRVSSMLWYRGIMAGSRTGYLSEVYVDPEYRGGLGLPNCDMSSRASPSPSKTGGAAMHTSFGGSVQSR